MSEWTITGSQCGYAHVWSHVGPRGSEPPVSMLCGCGKMTWAQALHEKAEAAKRIAEQEAPCG